MSKAKTVQGSGGSGGGSGGDPQLSFEQALAQIEAIIERIESGEVGLEQSLDEYQRGVALINQCRSKLSRAKQQVEDLTRRLESADEGESEGDRGGGGTDGDRDSEE